MNRKDREVTSLQKITEIVQECDTIRLGFADGLFPYIVPLSFGYESVSNELCFYVHSAVFGRKCDLLKTNGVCSFEMDCAHVFEELPLQNSATMRYKCVMGTAKAELLSTQAEKLHGLLVIMKHYTKCEDLNINDSVLNKTAVIKISVKEISAKANLPL